MKLAIAIALVALLTGCSTHNSRGLEHTSNITGTIRDEVGEPLSESLVCIYFKKVTSGFGHSRSALISSHYTFSRTDGTYRIVFAAPTIPETGDSNVTEAIDGPFILAWRTGYSHVDQRMETSSNQNYVLNQSDADYSGYYRFLLSLTDPDLGIAQTESDKALIGVFRTTWEDDQIHIMP